MTGCGGVVSLIRKQPIQGPSADFAGRLIYRGRPQDDKIMRFVSARTTHAHRHPEADRCNSGMAIIWPKDLDVGCYSKHKKYNKLSS